MLDRSCQLFTVLGAAGVGKSRLAAEFLASIEARIVRGRCLSYGEGITYWPVVEIVKQLNTLPEGDAAVPLRSLLGETDSTTSADEIAWGFRKLLEQEARKRPLVCLLDDLHWSEQTLLDLVEYVGALSRDGPILMLCIARPELLEKRPAWGGGEWNSTTVLLEPLDGAETERLLDELGGVEPGLRERIAAAAEGNPLFLEEMLALIRASGEGEISVPPTIQALLAARLDQLNPAERAVLECGAVEGRVFHQSAVQALGDGEPQTPQLVALVRKQIYRSDTRQFAGDEAYRFRHELIRDAAYDALPKAMRADLHERFADWLEERAPDLVERDEILGHLLNGPPATRRSSGCQTLSLRSVQGSGSPPPAGAPSGVAMTALRRRCSSVRSRSPARFGSTSISRSTSPRPSEPSPSRLPRSPSARPSGRRRPATLRAKRSPEPCALGTASRSLRRQSMPSTCWRVPLSRSSSRRATTQASFTSGTRSARSRTTAVIGKREAKAWSRRLTTRGSRLGN